MNKQHRDPAGGRGLTQLVALVTALAAIVSVLTLAAPPPVAAAPTGLVAALGFDEGSGTAARDRSGLGNHGTVSGATWTTGRYGSALSFASTTARVRVPDAPSLDLTAGLTVSAWVRPSSTSGTQVVAMKENPNSMAYALYASTGTTGGAARARTAALVNYSAQDAAKPAVGVWTHVAATYDGATLRMWRDGTQVAATATPAPLKLTDGDLEIGNNVWGEAFRGTIDEVRVYNRPLSATELRADATTSVATQTTPTTTTTTTTTIPARSGFPGDVSAGKVRWGAGIDGNGDPVARHEQYTGTPLGVRRTYWRWDQRTGSMLTTARGDAAANRVPWVSVKPPVVSSGSAWAVMGSGAYDAQIDEMLRGLATVAGPVWLTVHHEPEGGGGAVGPDDVGGASAWRAMQTRIRQRITGTGVTNVAFAPVLMSWTFDSRSGRNPLDWYVPGIWDFAGIDHYVEAESHPGPGTTQDTMWAKTVAFYSTRGLKLALGEWGNRGTDAQAAREMQAFYDQAVASGTSGRPQVIALAYFDSGLNSPTGSWVLAGEPLTRFRQLVSASTSIRATQR